MRKIRNFLMCCGILLATVGCSEQDAFLSQPQQLDVQKEAQSFQRTRTEALEEATAFFNTKSPNTRTSIDESFTCEARVRDSYSTRGSKTEQEVDTTLYFINRGNDDGFVVVSGDKRHRAIVGYALRGRFALKDVEENSNLQHYVRTYERFISFVHDSATLAYDKRMRDKYGNKWKLQLIPLHPDSMKLPGAPSLRQEYPKYYKWPTRSHQFVLSWGQKYPYNQQITPINGVRPSAGCVITAIAQLLAMHQQPKEVGNVQLHWTDIMHSLKNGRLFLAEKEIPTQLWLKSAEEVAGLYRVIANYSGTVYGSRGGHTEVDSVPTTLQKLGYTCSEDHAVDAEEIVSEINAARPVIMSGYSKRRNASHAWVVDAYELVRKEEYITHTAEFMKLKVTDAYYFRCNWGWDGRGTTTPNENSDAYFSLDHLLPYNRVVREGKDIDEWYQDYDFKYWMGCFTNIKYVGHE